MKKSSHPIDDFFRDALNEHEIAPSEAARSAFLTEASRRKARRTPRWIWWGGAIVGVLLLGVAGVMWYQNEGFKVQDSRYKMQASGYKLRAASDKLQASSYKLQASGDKLQTNISSDQPKLSNIEQQTSNIEHQESNIQHPEPSIQHPEPSIQYPASSIQQTDTLMRPDTIMRPDTTQVSPASKEEWKKKFTPEPDDHKLHFSLGASYTPEWMFQTVEGTKYVNNFGLETTFRFDRYSLRTGVGISIHKGTNEFVVEYNDYLGSYLKLDSMEFHWDAQHYYLLPTSYTSEQNVWDSATQTSYPTVEKRYTYLQIPLVLGYDFLQRGRFALGLRAGPIMSILLSSKQLTPSYDPGLNQIVLINQISPDRVQMNWQVMGGVSASFLVTNHLSFELEPEARYYFNSVYEKSDINTKPWSAGLRFAIMVKF